MARHVRLVVPKSLLERLERLRLLSRLKEQLSQHLPGMRMLREEK